MLRLGVKLLIGRESRDMGTLTGWIYGQRSLRVISARKSLFRAPEFSVQNWRADGNGIPTHFNLVHGLSASLPLKFGIPYLFTSGNHNHYPLSDVT